MTISLMNTEVLGLFLWTQCGRPVLSVCCCSRWRSAPWRRYFRCSVCVRHPFRKRSTTSTQPEKSISYAVGIVFSLPLGCYGICWETCFENV